MNELATKLILRVVGERARDAYGSLLRTVRSLRTALLAWPRRLRSSLSCRARARKLSCSPEGLQLHLGCGERRFEQMLNCEYRATGAADVIMDCADLSRFRDNSVSLIYSHSFFEHLYHNQQIPLLRDCHRVLREDAPLIFLGIPDFELVAKSYLKGVPGIPKYGEVFDLFHVYRYTHGNPEMAHGYWLEQLHKSLFDKKYVAELLSRAGFKYATIFNYCYPGEDIPLCLGFVAWKSKPTKDVEEVLLPFRDLPTGRLGDLYVEIDGMLPSDCVD